MLAISKGIPPQQKEMALCKFWHKYRITTDNDSFSFHARRMPLPDYFARFYAHIAISESIIYATAILNTSITSM